MEDPTLAQDLAERKAPPPGVTPANSRSNADFGFISG
jgi:hypothetical protein